VSFRIIPGIKDLSAHFCADYTRTLQDVKVESASERRRSRRSIGIIVSDRGRNHPEVSPLTDFRQRLFHGQAWPLAPFSWCNYWKDRAVISPRIPSFALGLGLGHHHKYEAAPAARHYIREGAEDN
jgi:hypothetical protein